MLQTLVCIAVMAQGPVEKGDIRATVTVLLVPERIACGPQGYDAGILSPCDELDADEVQKWVDAGTYPMCKQARVPPEKVFYFYEAFSVLLRAEVKKFNEASAGNSRNSVLGPSLLFLFDWDDNVRGKVHLERDQSAESDTGDTTIGQYSSPEYELPGGKNRWVAHHRADSTLLAGSFRWRLVLTRDDNQEEYAWYFEALPERVEPKSTKAEE